MALIVQKYGGTSVGSAERIKSVARRVARYRGQGHQVVVVSAISGETNRLIGLAKEIQAQPDPRELDVVVSTGAQVRITDNAFTKARILSIDVQNIRTDLVNAKSHTRMKCGLTRRILACLKTTKISLSAFHAI